MTDVVLGELDPAAREKDGMCRGKGSTTTLIAPVSNHLQDKVAGETFSEEEEDVIKRFVVLTRRGKCFFFFVLCVMTA